jgi:hypothetical protein
MKSRLASKKVVVAVTGSHAGPGGQHLVSLETPTEQVAATAILGHGVDAAASVVDLLTEIGVLG